MATVEQTMMKVQRIMTGPMGLQVMVQGDRFQVTFQDTSTFLSLRVAEIGQNEEREPRTVVLVTAPLLREVEPTPELFEWVARTGGSRWFGHVEVHDDGDSGKAEDLFRRAVGRPDFGNGRFARSLFEQAYARMALRASADGDVELNELTALAPEDLEWSEPGVEVKRRRIGFGIPGDREEEEEESPPPESPGPGE